MNNIINWLDPKCHVSKFLTVGECTFLPSWGIYHIPSLVEQNNILFLANKIDTVRDFIGKPVNIHCFIRPKFVNCQNSQYNNKDYNAFVKGCLNSAHVLGCAVDLDFGVDCDIIRQKLLPMLEQWGLRMERNEGKNWIHLDCAPVKPGGNRFFKP